MPDAPTLTGYRKRTPKEEADAHQEARDERRRRLKVFGLRECEEVVDLADRCARLEHEAQYASRNNGGADGMGAQGRLDSLRAGVRLLLSVDFAAGDDFFRAEGEDEADRFRVLRDGCAKKSVDKRQLTL